MLRVCCDNASAFRIAQEGVPGPVFIEFPLEVLWPEETTAEALRVDLTVSAHVTYG